jgi:HlyD family secretion protein
MNRKRLIAIAGAAALCALAWFVFRNGADANGKVKLYGNVDIREVELSFRVPGRLAEVRVDEGDAVKAGDVLATLDAQRYRDALAKAMGDRDVAAANMAKFRAGYRNEEVGQARALVSQMEAQVENAVRVARRREELLKSGAISAQERDDAVAQRERCWPSCRARARAFSFSPRATAPRRCRARRRVCAPQAAVAAAMTDLADTEIIAPADGRVLSRVREPGAMAQAGATVLVVSLQRPVWVRAYVPEPCWARCAWECRCWCARTAVGHALSGTVGFISPVAEFTPKTWRPRPCARTWCTGCALWWTTRTAACARGCRSP